MAKLPLRRDTSGFRGIVDRKLRILIVDDSIVVRMMLSRMLEDHPAFLVVGRLDRAERAIDWLRSETADIVLLDVEMPDRDGLAALPDIIAAGRGARIVMVSSSTARGASVTLRALANGAADAIAKPEIGALSRRFGGELIDCLLRVGTVHQTQTAAAGQSFTLRPPATGAVSIVAIGSSTGGLLALSTFFAALPLTFDAPILVTQHLPASFMPFFADQLSLMSRRPCSVARDGAEAVKGALYVAPGTAHLMCEKIGPKTILRLQTNSVANHSLPSVDPMFASIAAAFGREGVGIVFSGMGRDGADGASALADVDADVIVQDEVSSVIWGMPGAVALAGMASLCAPADDMARYLVRRGAL